MNRPIEREYREALDALRFSTREKERIMNNLMDQQERGQEKPAPRQGLRLLRTGLIAACMCAALVGTAFAASAVYQLTVQTYEDEEHDGQHYTGYYVYGEPVLHPLEDFPREFQDDFAAWDHPSILFNRHFDTWEEAKAYLGDNIPAVWHSMDDIICTDEYRVSALYEMYGDGKIKYVDVYNVAKLSNGLTYVTDIYIYTPDYSRDTLTSEGWWKDSADVRVLDSYTMANGCEAEIVMLSKTYEIYDDVMHDLVGTFMKDGLLYKIELIDQVAFPLDEAGLEAQLHQILDSFE